MFALVLGRNRDEDRLVEAAANQLDLSGADQRFETGEILGTIFRDPREQRAGIMQAHVDRRMFFEHLDERQIGIFEGLLQHVAKIAAGLMGMDEQDEMEALRQGDDLSQTSYRATQLSRFRR